MTNSKKDSEIREKLKSYNWSSDKDYQLACIAFRELAISLQEVAELLKDESIGGSLMIMGKNGEPVEVLSPSLVRNAFRAELRELLNGDKQ